MFFVAAQPPDSVVGLQVPPVVARAIAFEQWFAAAELVAVPIAAAAKLAVAVAEQLAVAVAD